MQFLKETKDYFFQLISQHRLEASILLAIVILNLLVKGFNFVGFPYLENDEATYAIRGWSFATDGSFDLYTYWYDHAPAGWILIGLWYWLSGELLLFASYLASARALMLIVSTLTAITTYLLAKRVTGKVIFSALAALVFIMSPLGTYYQRRVLLDNIMVLWLLLSLLIVAKPHLKIKDAVLSSLTFSIGVLTKLNAIFFLPAIVIALWRNSSQRIRRLSLIVWLGVTGAVSSLWPTYALLKGELWPINDNPESGIFDEGISLFDSMTYQTSRNTGSGYFWQTSSDIYNNATEWIKSDPMLALLFVFGLFSIPLLSIYRRKIKNFAPFTVLLAFLGMIFFLIRGKIVLSFYFIPIVPLAIIMGIYVLSLPIELNFIKDKMIRPLYIWGVVGLISLNYVIQLPTYAAFNVNETSNQYRAVEWVENNINSSAIVASDNYAVIYLNVEGEHKNVDYNFKVEYDPEIRAKIDDDWRNIDYLLVTSEVVRQMRIGRTPFILEAYNHSSLIANFSSDSYVFIDKPQLTHIPIDQVQIFKVKSHAQIISQDIWQSFSDSEWYNQGQISDSKNVLAINQVNALRQSIAHNDRQAFSQIYQQIKKSFQIRTDNLLVSQVRKNSNNINSATKGPRRLSNILYASSLIEAAEKWSTPWMLDEAELVVDDIWKSLVAKPNGQPILADQVTDQFVVNSADYAFRPLRIISQFDQTHNWQQLIKNGYEILDQAQSNNGLFPNSFLINATLQISTNYQNLPQISSNYGQAAQLATYWIAQDAIAGNKTAQQLLKPLAKTLKSKISVGLSSSYRLNGSAAGEKANALAYASALIVLDATDLLSDKTLNTYFNRYILSDYSFKDKSLSSNQLDLWLQLPPILVDSPYLTNIKVGK